MEHLNVFTTVESLQKRLEGVRNESKVSFVPTMGALHHGHISLVEKAFELADTVVVSIFVNPKQFNRQEDLNDYPRTLEADVKLLNQAGNVLIFAPNVDEVYPADFHDVDVDLGRMGEVMEGKFRPGHFKGVMNVVKRFFDIIQPDYALFGRKDHQQVAVINYMVTQLGMSVEIVPCETFREPSGLASSSRNALLNPAQLIEAEGIYQTLDLARKLAVSHTVTEVIQQTGAFLKSTTLEPEYISIVHPDTLEELDEWVPGARMCIAAYCGKVRLIDNIELL